MDLRDGPEPALILWITGSMHGSDLLEAFRSILATHCLGVKALRGHLVSFMCYSTFSQLFFLLVFHSVSVGMIYKYHKQITNK